MPALKSYHYFVTTATDWRGKPCCFIHVYLLQFDKKFLKNTPITLIFTRVSILENHAKFSH